MSLFYAAHTDIIINGSTLINATQMPFNVKKEPDGYERDKDETYLRC